MMKILSKARWFIIIFVVGIVIFYFTGSGGYAVSYDEVMDNTNDAGQYFEKIVLYVEPTHYEVRTRALSIVNDAPDGINVDSDAWKIWSINYWVSGHIKYVEDPPGGRYTNAYEVLQKKCGDCDDFSILIASMYESVGLDAALVLLDTDDVPGIDHMACLVYWPDDAKSFIDEEKDILRQQRITSPVSQVIIYHIYPGTAHLMLGKYTSGVLLFSDIIMGDTGCLVGYITHEPYEVIDIIDVGR
jgi:hypothetical protein